MTHRGRPGILVLTALLSAFCAAGPARSPQGRPRVAPVPPSVVQLRRDLTALFTDPAIDHAQWAVRVDSLAMGEPLFTYNGHRLMLPASNQKLLTAAVAAERLGWDHRFTTRLATNGVVDASGNLKGDLFVVGDGDPSINPRHAERWRAFDDWGVKLHALGIRVIDGHLIGDDRLIDEPGWGEGWSWDDLQYGYGAPASALQYNENQIEVMVGPGMTAGAPAIVVTSPLGSGLLVDNQAVTVATDADTKIDVSRMPGTVFLVVRGQIAEGAKPATTLAAVDNPTSLYVSALREALARHGIFVGGSALDVDELRTVDVRRAPLYGVPGSLRELIVDRSPPLSEIVDVMLKWSRNNYAETVLTALGTAAPLQPANVPHVGHRFSGAEMTTPTRTAADTPPAARTAADGLLVLQSTLDAWGITKTAYLSRDGSGLSRMDYVSADALVMLLTRMWVDPKLREPFRTALPVAGVSGTLAERLKDTPAAGRVWAKTGTLSNVRALSGYLDTRAGEPLVFSVLVNNFVVPQSEVDAIVDKALLKLIELPLRRAGR